MTLVLNGTTGVSAVDGSASTPAIQGNDTNTGVFFPAADTVAVATGGSERVRVDSSGNVGVGTSSPGARLQVTDGNFSQLYLNSTTTVSGVRFGNTGSTNGYIYYDNGANLTFQTNGAERARIDSSGNLMIATTTALANARVSVSVTPGGTEVGRRLKPTSNATYYPDVYENSSGTTVGSISVTSSATAYNTSSDYRLKHDIAPMTGALAKVASLKPVIYKWNVDDSDGEGFIAHELAQVCPGAVTGEKDAVDAEGNIVPQGIDTSFLVATLTAAIQELNAKVESLTAEIATLKGAQA